MEERDGVPEPHNFSFLYCPRLTSFISTYLSLVKRSLQTQSFPVAYVFVPAPKKHYFVSQNEMEGKQPRSDLLLKQLNTCTA